MAVSKRQILRELSWRKCKGESPQDLEALLFFLRNYVFIQHPEQGSIKFDLRPAQEEILATWTQERYSIVLKARQIGWSTLVAGFALWLTFFWPDQAIIMLSKGEREAEKLLQKATYAYDRLPPWMRERGPKRTSRNLKKLSFANASVIESMPSKEDPGRSSTASLVIVDEWAFLENAEEAWASIEPIADVGGRVIGLSTANGSGNFFHQFWIRATTGVSDFKAMFYPWWANTDRDDDWYETRKRSMLEWQLHQEYPSNPDEAFIKSGNPVFDLDALAAIGTEEPRRYALSWDDITRPRIDPSPDGELSIWYSPSNDDEYVLGADVAEGLEHGDFSAAYVISRKYDRVAASWHGHIPPDLFGDVITAMGYLYRKALIGCEVNNHGLTTVTQVKRNNYPRIYYRRTLDQRTKKMQQQIGWLTTKASKPILVDELARALRGELILEDAKAIGELRTYVRDEKGQMHGSPFDDRVMALGVANQMRQYRNVYATDVEADNYWTFDYFLNKVTGPKDGEYVPMGVHNVRP
jgi:hypothetical protein